MSSVITLLLVLFIIIAACLAFIFFHHKENHLRASSLSHRLERTARENNMILLPVEKFKNFIFGLDAGNNKLIVCNAADEQIIDLDGLKRCRKEKKWLHIPAEKGKKPETHLEKISLLFDFKGERLSHEIVFYEYRHNSIFQMHELEQKADYWELLFNRQIIMQ